MLPNSSRVFLVPSIQRWSLFLPLNSELAHDSLWPVEHSESEGVAVCAQISRGLPFLLLATPATRAHGQASAGLGEDKRLHGMETIHCS